MSRKVLVDILIVCFLLFGFQNQVVSQILPFNVPDFKNTVLEEIPISRSFVDRDGFYWLAGDGIGFVRYDGKRTEVFELAPSTYYVAGILQDPEGYLWIGLHASDATGSGLYVSNQPITGLISDSLKFVQKHKGTQLLTESIHPGSISMNKDGDILVNSIKLLVRYQNLENNEFYSDTIQSYEGTQEGGAVTSSIVLDNGDLVYKLYPHKRIYHKNYGLENESIEEFENPPFFASILYSEDNKNRLWSNNYNMGLQYFELDKPEILHEIPIDGGSARMVFLDDNTILSSNAKGMEVIDVESKQVIKSIGINEGMLNTQIHGLHKNKNTISISTQFGLHDISTDFNAFSLYDNKTDFNQEPFLNLESVQTIRNNLQLGNIKNLCAITGFNGMTIFDANYNFEVLSVEDGLLDQIIADVISDKEGRLWMSKFGPGNICIYPPEKKHKQVEKKGSINIFDKKYDIGIIQGNGFRLSKVTLPPGQDKDSLELIIAGKGFPDILFDDQKPVMFTLKNGYNNSAAKFDVVLDQNAFIYFSSNHGLYKSIKPWTSSYFRGLKKVPGYSKDHREIQGEILKKIDLTWEQDTLPACTSMELIKNEIWFSFENGIGVFSIDEQKMINFIKTDKHVSPRSILELENQVWVNSNIGLTAYDIETKEKVKQIHQKDGLMMSNPSSSKSLSKDQNNHILTASKLGMSKYDPSLSLSEAPELICKIRDYAFIENDYGKNSLKVEYIGLDQLRTENIKYKFKLDGHDDEWSLPTEDVKVNYTNLSAVFFDKKYTFELQAQNYKGDWFELKEPLEICVSPPIWSRWWSFICYFIVGYFLIKKYLKNRLELLSNKLLAQEAQTIMDKNTIIEEKNAQNELLLKEIHHRVKNNLQTISSLLFLQSSGLKDKDAKEAIKAVQQRVESMALIHRKLYEEDHLSQIEMSGYVRLLAENLIDSFGYGPNDVLLDIQIKNIFLDMDQAIPMGLILNELITNILKYAFPEREGGLININLSFSEKNLVLFIKDNGIGKKESVVPSFGSKLIDLLTRQLDGNLTNGNDKGYWTKIEFEQFHS